MPTSQKPSMAHQMIGNFAPKLAELTDEVLFGDVWERKELSPRDRSLITVSALITGGNTEQLGFHLNKARGNGLTEDELIEVSPPCLLRRMDEGNVRHQGSSGFILARNS